MIDFLFLVSQHDSVHYIAAIGFLQSINRLLQFKSSVHAILRQMGKIKSIITERVCFLESVRELDFQNGCLFDVLIDFVL